MNPFDLAPTALRILEPETAHRLTIALMRAAPFRPPLPDDPRLRVDVLGQSFPNPVGLAAGFDKNAEVVDATLALGFGFAEAGTVTPLPQSGNPRPRIFRLPRDRAVINRLGFNNDGHEAAKRRLERRADRPGIIGINIGANKDASNRIADYVRGVEAFAPLAAYLTLNVSSPNTPGLRDLQTGEALDDLLRQVLAARDAIADRNGQSTPLLVKVAPDLDDNAFLGLADRAAAGGVEGFIVSNTTLSREGLKEKARSRETGGLSGPPLFARSTRMVAMLRRHFGPGLVIIGVGGIDSPQAAWEKITAGADLVQLYTGLVYEGPSLVTRIKAGLIERLGRANLSSLSEARGSNLDRWVTAEGAAAADGKPKPQPEPTAGKKENKGQP